MNPWPRRNQRRLQGPWDVVNGTTPEGLPYPIEFLRYTYVTPFGGFSDDLDQGEIGLHQQALLENTELEEGDEVMVRVLDHARPGPMVYRESYVLVGLDFQRPEAWVNATHGEAILSAASLPDRDTAPLHQPGAQLHVVINGVLARRLGGGVA